MTPSERQSAIAQRLAQARAASGLTGAQVADRLGRARATVHEWENGNTSPNAVDVVGLADVYGVSLDWLLARDADTTFVGLIDTNALHRLLSAKTAKDAYRALPQIAVKVSDQVRVIHDLDEFAEQIRRAHAAIVDIERKRGRE